MPGMSGPGGAPAPGAGAGSTLQFNIDADKLPSAEELRSKLFPSVIALTADDQEVKIITRDSFPDVVATAAVGGVGVALLMPAIQAARTAAQKAAGAAGAPGVRPPGGAGAATPGPGLTPPGAPPASAPGGASRPGQP